ncbi:MAG: thiolase domain-containing protein [Anaerolineae bacterium]|nr:thiolase domain-containing protein [Anaerolineae bacterium]
MRDVAIIGVGQIEVGEHWDTSLRHLALGAVQAAIADAGVAQADALYVGNMLSGELAGQEHLGALVADFAGLRGIEAVKIEAACGSGAAALRMGYVAVAGGLADVVIVAGVEKMTDVLGQDTTAALTLAADGDYEAFLGITFVAVNALLMQRYMHEYGYSHQDFAPFAVNAHKNAVNNPYAMFRFPITAERFAEAKMIATPINLLDSSPICDGAAAVVLAPADMARSLSAAPIRIAASAIGTDSLAVHDRRDPMVLDGAVISTRRAYEQANAGPEDIDLFELHDAFSVMAALSLEGAGFAEKGQGLRLALDGEVGMDGKIPVTTMGGLKARGHPVGATGMYQIVEVVQQLRGLAGKNQVKDARLGMAQNIGGSGATVVTHILERMDG